MTRSSLDEDDQMALQNEVEILSQIDHPNVLKLMAIYEEPTNLCLVLELMQGGEVTWFHFQLFDRIVERDHYSEKEASDTIRPIADAIRYCHNLGIIHRDLKVMVP